MDAEFEIILKQHPFLCVQSKLIPGFSYADGSSGTSGLDSSPRSLVRMTADITAARAEVTAKFSQIPVSPKGHSAMINITGKIRAVDTEIRVAGRGFSMASI